MRPSYPIPSPALPLKGREQGVTPALNAFPFKGGSLFSSPFKGRPGSGNLFPLPFKGRVGEGMGKV